MATCLFCQLPFTSYPTSKGKPTVLCGVVCRNRFIAAKQCGKNNHRWKGDMVSYFGIHAWLRKNLPRKAFCEICQKKKKLDAANISGKYRRDFADWRWLCRRCHLHADGVVQKLVARSKARVRPMCGVQGCQNRHQAKGMCKMHYYRVYRASRRKAEAVCP